MFQKILNVKIVKKNSQTRTQCNGDGEAKSQRQKWQGSRKSAQSQKTILIHTL
jgi:hypothetical protein